LRKDIEHLAAIVDRLISVRVTEQQSDGRDRLAAVGQARDEFLKILGRPAKRRKLNGMRSGTGEQPLIG
jgi:hypothetical protein